jgi:SAM-dependent methyltransferase
MAIYLQARARLTRAKRAVRRTRRTSFAVARLAVAFLRSRVGGKGGHSSESIVTALYRGMLDREPDLTGLADHLNLLTDGKLLEVIRRFVGSPEFRARFVRSLVPVSPLPDLKVLLADHYETQRVAGAPATVYVARTDEDVALMSSLIEQHRYYDRFGVWSPVIDRDKEITAAIVRGLGAQSCFELGCFTGAVISLLAQAGLRVAGAEISHLAFAFAYPNVRDNMIFGNLLALDLRQRFDVVLCMDVLEHVNPLQLDAYIEKLASLVDDDGYLYLNAPMWGHDRIFGVFEEPYLQEWLDVGAASYWRHWPCDQSGWPIHGHLVWANADWWEEKFRHHGLVRDEVIERTIQLDLEGFFEHAIGRRCVFVLRRPESRRASAAMAAKVHSALASCL